MQIFKSQNLLEFAERFKTDANCKEYLANIKCNDEVKFAGIFSRMCNKFSHMETTIANALFHKVNLALAK